MEQLLNAITQEEYDWLDDYRCENVDNDIDYHEFNRTKDFIPSRQLLSVWAKRKEDLFTLFGEKLIISKEVSFQTPYNELYKKIYDLLENAGSATSYFFTRLYFRMKDKSNELADLNPDASEDLIFVVEQLPNWARNMVNPIVDNKVPYYQHYYTASHFEATLPNGVKINVDKNTKLMRVLGRYAKAYGLEEEFEKFRLEHSLALNQKSYTGELCISIHPLDYVTMSNNSNNWSSCMSWLGGEYCRGTVEMMNSSCVIVAYLRDPNKNYLYWNSKKWRELFVVNELLIAGIKGYPYQSTELENYVIEMLRELAEKNWGCTYLDPEEKETARSDYELTKIASDKLGNCYCFTTDAMYNDFRSRNQEHTHLIAVREGIANRDIEIDYSGLSQCMVCGSTTTYFEDEGRLFCDDCIKTPMYCYDCGCIVDEDDVTYINGEVGLCPECFRANTATDPFSGTLYYEPHATIVYIVPDDFNQVDLYEYFTNNRQIDLPHFQIYTNEYSLLSYYRNSPALQDAFYENFNEYHNRWMHRYYTPFSNIKALGWEKLGLDKQEMQRALFKAMSETIF